MHVPKVFISGVTCITVFASVVSAKDLHTHIEEYPNQDTTRIEMFVSSTTSTGHMTPLIVYNSLGKVIYLK